MRSRFDHVGRPALAGGALRAHAAANPRPYQSADERSYVRIAIGVATDWRYGDADLADPQRWPPGAPMLFAAAHRLRPTAVDPAAPDVPAAYAVQAVVATALIPAVFVLAALVGGAWAGVASAGLVAVYPPLAQSPQDLLSEPLGALLATAAAIAVALALRRPAWWKLVLAGVLLGATVLTRADLLVLPAIAVAVVGVAGWRAGGARAGLGRAGLLATVTGLVIAPWMAFAAAMSGRLVPVTSGGASNLFVGTYLPGDGSMFGAKRELGPEVHRRLPQWRATRPTNIPQGVVMSASRCGARTCTVRMRCGPPRCRTSAPTRSAIRPPSPP